MLRAEILLVDLCQEYGRRNCECGGHGTCANAIGSGVVQGRLGMMVEKDSVTK